MLLGREKEISTLSYCFESDKSEFVAVYGRRRVGKTFLIKEFFQENFTFFSTGILDGDKETQLLAWNREISRYGGSKLVGAKNWFHAFENLNKLIEQSGNQGKKVIFLDEIPWMATIHSDFLAGLDYFWNRWASSRKDVLLIVCGSAATWITEKIINNTGGLHNRLTRHIFVEPFALKECEKYFESHHIPLNRYQMAEAYMIFGGIPYYLSLMDPKYSLYQNVDEIYFSQKAWLRNEFENLFRSLYIDAENYIRVVETLAKKGIGLTRNDIAGISGISDGGNLTRILENLSISGFIREYKAYGKKKKDSLFQLIDFFVMFDVRFRNERKKYTDDYWLQFSSTSAHSVWNGISFEKLCLLHLPQIRKKLGISGVLTAAYSWRGKLEDKGAQVDLVIDRNDNIINLCEVKFSSKPITLRKSDSESLRNKRAAFIDSTRTKKAVITTFVSTYGLIRNSYSADIYSEVVLDDLFE
jgi:AAA+ ATPase superfamily predicted ATPase